MKKTEAEKIHRLYQAKSNVLEERECDIIERYYGFNGNFRHTLEEIASSRKLTRERVRQIKHYALKKIGAVDS